MADRTSEQTILEKVYDAVFKALAVQSYGYDGQNIQRITADALARKITVSGSYTYIGIAAPGTAQSTDKWQCCKIDESVAGTTVFTWADGNAEFDNVATDLTALTYS